MKNRNGTIPIAHAAARRGARIGVAIATALIIWCLVTMLTGCKGLHDPCEGHGGTVNLNKGLYTCADGSIV